MRSVTDKKRWFWWGFNSGNESQTAEISEHSHRACNALSACNLQWSQLSSWMIFHLFKFFLTGSASLQDRHRKFFTLFGAFNPQISFQTPPPWFWFTVVGWTKFSLVRKQYLDLTVYIPEGVYGQTSLSSTWLLHKGMLDIISNSWALNRPCSKAKSHCHEAGSMRSHTWISSRPTIREDNIRGYSRDGSHASFQTPIDSPHPTLHLTPLMSTSRSLKMLCQA